MARPGAFISAVLDLQPSGLKRFPASGPSSSATVARRRSRYPAHHLVYDFLTAPNATVRPIHPKAMPVILTMDKEHDVWVRALCDETKVLCQMLS
jgi:hypothetical protein